MQSTLDHLLIEQSVAGWPGAALPSLPHGVAHRHHRHRHHRYPPLPTGPWRLCICYARRRLLWWLWSTSMEQTGVPLQIYQWIWIERYIHTFQWPDTLVLQCGQTLATETSNISLPPMLFTSTGQDTEGSEPRRVKAPKSENTKALTTHWAKEFNILTKTNNRV